MKNECYRRIALALGIAGLVLPALAIITLQTAHGAADAVSPITFSFAEQLLITTVAFVLKPVYEIMALAVAILLWRRADPDLAALRRAALAFFIGENACAANYLFFNEQSTLMEFFHTYGMAACFGLVVFALMEAFDHRVFHFSEREKKCVLLPLCGRCYKYNSSRCNLRRLFLFIIPTTAVLSAVPLTAPLGNHFYSGRVLGNLAVFGQPVAYQLLETRFYPVVAMLFFILSFYYLAKLGEDGFEPSKIFYAMGIGPLGFSLLRFFFYWGYQQNPLWADAWEELTEFLFVAVLLRIVLRVYAVSRQARPEHRISKRSASLSRQPRM